MKNWRYYIGKYFFTMPEDFSFGTENRLKRFWKAFGMYLLEKTMPKNNRMYVPFRWVLDNSVYYKKENK